MALKKIGPATVTASGAGWSIRKTGLVVELCINGLESTQPIPVEFAPPSMTYVPVSAQSNTSSYTPRVAINPSGVLTPQGYSGKAYAIITYTV